LVAVALDLRAHVLHDLCHRATDNIILNSCAPQDCTQNAGIGVAMNMETIQADLATQDSARGIQEGEVMDGIAAVEKCSVNVEEISVSRVPPETVTYKCLAGGVWHLGFHLALDSECGSRGCRRG
jgi:hypothetical protein